MFYKFLEDDQLNFQINRMVTYGDEAADINEIWSIVPKIKDMGTWYEAWIDLASKAEKQGNYAHAFYYYRMAEFYLTDDRKEKMECYHKFKDNFYKAYKNDNIETFEVPYEGTYLPAMRIKSNTEKGTILIHGGFDSFMEEFYLGIKQCNFKDYTIIFFEGPGQGQARKNGLTFCYNWEKPTSAVIDYFKLDDVTLIGISWGGYLCLRAAAFDKRIKNVICYDIFYCGMDMLTKKIPLYKRAILLDMLNKNKKEKVNNIFEEKVSESLDLKWKVNHGMYITGTETPFDYFKSLQKHTVNGIGDKITQNVLLLAGEEDQYVPVKRMETLKNELVNAKSITSRIFTKKDGGEQHCQVGNTQLVAEEITKFLNLYAL